MISIKFDRDSVCMGDDCKSHAVSLEVDEKMTVDCLISLLYSKPNAIAKISGGKATWILQIKNGEYYIDLAVFTEQWKSAKLLKDLFATVGEIVDFYKPTEFFAKYLAQKNPNKVYKSLEMLRR
ncbi:MAG: hypothetical protein FWH03_02080 [Firmicutes bacterium]|nr:hypothetical protein [Bacillota bacterium]